MCKSTEEGSRTSQSFNSRIFCGRMLPTASSSPTHINFVFDVATNPPCSRQVCLRLLVCLIICERILTVLGNSGKTVIITVGIEVDIVSIFRSFLFCLQRIPGVWTATFTDVIYSHDTDFVYSLSYISRSTDNILSSDTSSVCEYIRSCCALMIAHATRRCIHCQKMAAACISKRESGGGFFFP